jgi:hypothetical protein
VAETTAKRLPCCRFRRTGKAVGYLYQCWWNIGREILFSIFQYHVLHFISICEIFTDSSSYSLSNWMGKIRKMTTEPLIRYPRHSSNCQSLASHRGGPGSIPGLVKWDLWWTKWRWGGFSPSTSVSLANLHSTNCSTITLTYHLGLVQ